MSTARAHRLTGTVMSLLATTSVLAVAGSLAQVGLLGPRWWALPLLAVFAAAYVSAVVRAAAGRPPELPAAALLVAGVVALATAPLVAHPDLVGADGAHAAGWPWHTAVAAVTGCAVLLRQRPLVRGAVAVAALGLVLALLRAMPPTSVPAGGDRLVDGAYLVALGTAVFISTRGVEDVSAALRTARTEATHAQEEAEDLARAEAERAVWEAAVHDEVLTALRAAETAEGAAERRAASGAAHRALAQLAADPAVLSVSSSGVRDRVDAAVREVLPHALVDVAARAGALPGPVAEAVVDAVTELVRNSRRHNGPGVGVTVAGSIGPGAVDVRVDDDGRGFDPAAVSPARLGLSVSVMGRMRAVGGTASILSSPGGGAGAELRWQR